MVGGKYVPQYRIKNWQFANLQPDKEDNRICAESRSDKSCSIFADPLTTGNNKINSPFFMSEWIR